MSRKIFIILAILCLVTGAVKLRAEDPDPVERGISWLLTQQRKDGSFGKTVDADVSYLMQAVYEKRGIETQNPSIPSSNLWDLGVKYFTTGDGDALSELCAAQEPDGSWAGRVDLTAMILANMPQGAPQSTSAFSFIESRISLEGWTSPARTSLVILAALRHGRQELLLEGINTLLTTQFPNGSWGEDEISTALACLALQKGSGSLEHIQDGLAYLSRKQQSDGSWGSVNSLRNFTTAWIICFLNEINPNSPELNPALSFMEKQKLDGLWFDGGLAVRDTAVSLEIIELLKSGSSGSVKQAASNFLSKNAGKHFSEIADKLSALGKDVHDPLYFQLLSTQQNPDGGFGSCRGELTNPLDTINAMRIYHVEGNHQNYNSAKTSLFAKQNSNGSWGIYEEESVYLTALICQNLADLTTDEYQALQKALDYLESRITPEGSVEDSVLLTAQVSLALQMNGRSISEVMKSFFIRRQTENGSWDNNIYTTAVVLKCLTLADRLPDIAVSLREVPAAEYNRNVTICAEIENPGKETLRNVIVRFTREMEAIGPDQTVVELLPGQKHTLSVNVTASTLADVTCRVTADPGNQIQEYNELNNQASVILKTLPPAPQDFSASPGDGAVNLSWQPVNIAGITGYYLYRNNEAQPVTGNLPYTGLAFTDTGLTNGNTYTYKLVAVTLTGTAGRAAILTARPAAPLAGIDLSVHPGDISVHPATAHQGETVTLRTYIYNLGGQAAENVSVSLLCGGEQIGEDVIIPRLVFGEPQQIVFNWRPMEIASNQVYTVAVDQGDNIAELDETNNRAQASISVAASPDLYADPAAMTVEIWGAGWNQSHDWYDPGYISITFTITNSGAVDAGEFEIYAYAGLPGASPSLGGSITISGLAAGESRQVILKTHARPADAAYIKIDPGNHIQESNEDNNITAKALVRNQARDLKVQLAENAIGVQAGLSNSFRMSLINRGLETLELNLSKSCEDEVALIPSKTLVNLPSGCAEEIIWQAEGNMPGDYHVRFTATDLSGLSWTVDGLVKVCPTLFDVHSLNLQPSVAVPGQEVRTAANIVNNLGWSDTVLVDIKVYDENNVIVWQLPAPEKRSLPLSSAVSEMYLGQIATRDLIRGKTYRVKVDFYKDLTLIAHSETDLKIGEGISARVTQSATQVPPGASEITLTIDTQVKYETGNNYGVPPGTNVAAYWRGTRAWGAVSDSYLMNDGKTSTYGHINKDGTAYFEFVRPYEISVFQTKFNVGVKEYRIDYSLDGVNWTLGEQISRKAETGWETYEINPAPIKYYRICIVSHPQYNSYLIYESRALTTISSPPAPVEAETFLQYISPDPVGFSFSTGDINNDGVTEIVAVGAGWSKNKGKLIILNGRNYNVLSETDYGMSDEGYNVKYQPLFGDVDNDGDIEIVRGPYIFSSNGLLEKTIPAPVNIAQTIGNVDNDPDLEIVTCNSDIKVYKYDGTCIYNQSIDASSIVAPVIADIDLDGRNEIIVMGRNQNLFTIVDFDSVNTPVSGFGLYGESHRDLLISDLDLDGKPEIICSIHYTEGDQRVSKIIAYSNQGRPIWEFADYDFGFGGDETIKIADVNGDGYPELVFSGRDSWSRHKMYVLGHDGHLVWSTTFDDVDFCKYFNNFVLYDFNNDGKYEMLGELGAMFDLGTYNFLGVGGIHHSYHYSTLFTVCDINDDGHAEVLVAKNENLGINEKGILMVLSDTTWAPARNVREDRNYRITNITDDCKIPMTDPHFWKIHNTFRVQNRPDTVISYGVTMEQNLTPNVMYVPGSANETPLENNDQKLSWYYRLSPSGPREKSITYKLRLDNLQPGQTYQITDDGSVDYVWTGGSGSVALPPVTVTTEHIVSLSPSRIEILGCGAGNSMINIHNYLSTDQTFTWSILGLPAGWVDGQGSVMICAGQTAQIPLEFVVPAGIMPGTYRFVVRIETSSGIQDSTAGELVFTENYTASVETTQADSEPESAVNLILRFESASYAGKLNYTVNLTDYKGQTVLACDSGEIDALAWQKDVSVIIPALPAGEYTVQFTVYRCGIQVAAGTAPVIITILKSLKAVFQLDRTSYTTRTGVNMLASVANTGVNWDYPNLTYVFAVLDPAGVKIAEQTLNSPVVPVGGSDSKTWVWNTGSHPAGYYTAQLTILDNGLAAAQEQVEFEILPAAETPRQGLTGQLTVEPRQITGVCEQSISYQVANTGNTDLAEMKLRVEVRNQMDQTLVQFEDITGLNTGESKNFAHAWTVNQLPGMFTVYLFLVKEGEELEVLSINGFMVIDNNPPVTSHAFSRDPYIAENVHYFPAGTTITLNAADPESGVAETCFFFEDQNIRLYENPIEIPPGRHTLSYYSIDRAGNPETLHVLEIFGDFEAPATAADHIPTWASKNVQINLTASDSGSGVKETRYRINCGEWITGNQITVAQEGVTIIEYYSIDNVGNTEPIKSVEIRIDMTAPVTQAQYPVEWVNTEVNVVLAASDSGSGVKETRYRINGGEWITGDDFTVTEEGIHIIEFYSIDEAGNEEAVQAIQAKIDKTAPELTLHSPQNGANYYIGQEIPVDFTASDSLSGIADSDIIYDEQDISGNRIVITEGGHVLTVTVFDAAGNNVMKQVEFSGIPPYIDLPCIKINPVSWNKNTGVFTVSFTRPAGFDPAAIAGATCDGAPVVETIVEDGKIILKFRRDQITEPLDTTFLLLVTMNDGTVYRGVGTVKKIIN